MNILYISHIFPNNIDGVFGVFTLELAKKVRQKHLLTVIAPIPFFPPIAFFKRWNQYNEISRREVMDAINIYHPRILVLPKNLLKQFRPFFYYWGTINLVKKIIEENSIDVIHAHFTFPDGIAAFLIAKKFKLPLIITCHCGLLPKDMKLPIIRYMAKKAYVYASKILSVSITNKTLIESLVEKKVELINNGVDLEKFKLRDYSDNASIIRILSVGKLRKEKGFDFLFHAVESIKRDGYNVELTLIGRGDEKENLLQLSQQLSIENEVNFIDYVSHYHLSDYLSKHDMFVLPSIVESFGVVLIEAMATGCPVITTSCGGPERLVNSDCGIVVSPGDSQELKKAILYIKENFRLFNPTEIRKFSLVHFSIEAIAEKNIEVYKGVLKNDLYD